VKNNPIIKFNSESVKPPLIFGVYNVDNKQIFTPFFYNKNSEFNLDSLKGKIQIIAYLAKSVPDNFKSRSILDLEAFSILTALHSLQRYISNTKCHLLTDSRVLYYLFHQKIGDSSVKIRRWVLKLISDYPLITLHFIRTNENLADYLTRQGLPKGDLEKLNLKNVEVQDFYDKLPQEEFSLAEWAQFCNENPNYLTINNHSVNLVTSSLTNGIKNLESYTVPINILRSRLERLNFIKYQKIELKNEYETCLKSNNFEYINADGQNLSLELDLLMINVDNTTKIYVPPSLIGPLLAYTHLLGHMGVAKMVENLQNYHIEHMYTACKKLCTACYGCFLNHGSSRKNKILTYPVPNHPFEEVSMDIAESLNTVHGYSHLLILQDVLTDYIMVFPLKTKTTSEISRILLYSVLQHFNISKIHSDNATCFRNKEFLKLMSVLNITVINSSALNPSSRGKAEKAVGQLKLMLKKMLTTSENLNWDLLPFLITKIFNHSISPKTKQKPIEMLVGKGPISKAFFELDFTPKLHHSIKNNKSKVDELNKILTNLTQKGLENWEKVSKNQYESVNKNRVVKNFHKGDIVYVIDRYIFIGNPRPLKSKYYPSPWVVLKPYHTTCLIQRIADGFRTLYSNDAIKKLTKEDPIIKNLPKSVRKILEYDFFTYRDKDFQVIALNDALSIPDNTELEDSLPPRENNPDEDKSFDPLFPKQGEGLDPEPDPAPQPSNNNNILDNNESDNSDDNLSDDENNDEGIKLRSGKQVRFK
jgi:transposase InsO family protein